MLAPHITFSRPNHTRMRSSLRPRMADIPHATKPTNRNTVPNIMVPTWSRSIVRTCSSIGSPCRRTVTSQSREAYPLRTVCYALVASYRERTDAMDLSFCFRPQRDSEWYQDELYKPIARMDGRQLPRHILPKHRS